MTQDFEYIYERVGKNILSAPSMEVPTFAPALHLEINSCPSARASCWPLVLDLIFARTMRMSVLRNSRARQVPWGLKYEDPGARYSGVSWRSRGSDWFCQTCWWSCHSWALRDDIQTRRSSHWDSQGRLVRRMRYPS
jgi:hypothetical protein